MSKKIKFKNYECHQKLNYLLQISEFTATQLKNENLATHYGRLFDALSKKTTTKVDTVVKRQICDRCKLVLEYDTTANVKVKKRNGKTVVCRSCKMCGFSKDYPVGDDKRLWCENQENVIEIIDNKDSE